MWRTLVGGEASLSRKNLSFNGLGWNKHNSCLTQMWNYWICKGIICGYLKRRGEYQMQHQRCFSAERIPEFGCDKAALSGVWNPFSKQEISWPSTGKAKAVAKRLLIYPLHCHTAFLNLLLFISIFIIPWICCGSDFLGEPSSSSSLGIVEKFNV